jgi:hypothetical protein
MDFSKTNIIEILESAIPKRFQDFPPSDFEDFIAQVFKDNGYEVQQTSYSGDFGADLILEKDKSRIAVQVKKYSAENKVGVKDINQLIGGQRYYNCDDALIITTSSFTKSGSELASKTNLKCWDWNKLQKYISLTYLDGKSYFDFFGENQNLQPELDNFDFSITKILHQVQMMKVGSCTLIHATISNKTKRNLFVNLAMPIYVTKNNDQIEAIYWYQGYFNTGLLYAGCKVEVAFMFKTEQLPTTSKQDQIIFRWYDENHNLCTKQCKVEAEENSKELIGAFILTIIFVGLFFLFFYSIGFEKLILVLVAGFFIYIFVKAFAFIFNWK